MNNQSYVLEDTPVLLATYTGLYNNSTYKPHPLTIPIKSNDYVQVILQNGPILFDNSSEPHPFHLVSREDSFRRQRIAHRASLVG